MKNQRQTEAAQLAFPIAGCFISALIELYSQK